MMTTVPRSRLMGAFFISALGCAPFVQAQTSVTVNGGVDAFVGSMRNSGDAERTSVVGSGGMSTSWFGVRGVEQLGGGMAVEFALNGFFQTDTGASGRFAGDTMFSRDAYVAIRGPFGRLQAGRGSAPSFLPNILFNPFGDSFTFAPLVLHSYVPSGQFGARTWTAASAGDSGWSNQLVYTLPSIGGLSASLHYQAGEGAGRSGRNNAAVSALYSKGPLAISAFVHRVRVGNPRTDEPIVDATRSPVNYALMDEQRAGFAGISYDFTRVKLYGTWQRSVNEVAGRRAMRDRTYSVGLSAPAGGGAILLGMADTRRSGSLLGAPRSRRTSSLGYDYRLSKRSDVYAVAMRDQVTTLPSATSYAVGLRHLF